MFGKTVIKILRQQLSRERAEKRELQRKIDELIDRIAFQKTPARLVQKTETDKESKDWETNQPSDAYSAALREAEKEALEKDQNK